jgi:hypothetical protein
MKRIFWRNFSCSLNSYEQIIEIGSVQALAEAGSSSVVMTEQPVHGAFKREAACNIINIVNIVKVTKQNLSLSENAYCTSTMGRTEGLDEGCEREDGCGMFRALVRTKPSLY